MTTIALTAPRIVTAEWRKEVSLRSTWWALAVLAASVVGAGIVNAVGVAVGELAATPAEIGPLGGTLAGLSAAEIVVAVFGVLAVSGEYASGQIRSSFTAVPARTPVVLAKAGVTGATVLILTVVLLAVTFLANRIMLGGAGYPLALTAEVTGALVGSAVYLAAVAVLGGALAWLVRSTAGALGLIFGLIYVLPVIGLVLPDTIAAQYTRFLLANAGAAMRGPGGGLPGWAAYLTVGAWVVAFVWLAVTVVRRRDV